MWADQPTRSLHQLLSAGLQVIYPMGLNGGNQSVTINLPGLLHSGSSVTTDEHPYIKIDIPSSTPEEQDGANPPLGGVHALLKLLPHPRLLGNPESP